MRVLIPLLVGVLGVFGVQGESVADTVAFSTADGVELVGDWQAPTRPDRGVLLALHGVGGDKGIFDSFKAAAASEGLGLLSFDFRRAEGARPQQNASAGNFSLETARQDVRAALRFLQGRGFAAEKVVLIGVGRGASMALNFVAKSPATAVKAAILVAPTTAGSALSPQTDAPSWGDRPLLLVSSRGSQEPQMRTLYAAFTDRSQVVWMQLPVERVAEGRILGHVPGIEARLIEWVAIRFGKRVGP
jgi:pimeloyl-ACP methyl ester carboxylesterase